MKKKALLNRTLCLKFCSFYKPGKNEELVCGGYAAVERLILSGKVGTALQQSGRRIDGAKTELLVQAMCPSCDFHEQDCDFFRDRYASPCGGFVFLAQCIADGLITADDAR